MTALPYLCLVGIIPPVIWWWRGLSRERHPGIAHTISGRRHVYVDTLYPQRVAERLEMQRRYFPESEPVEVEVRECN